MVRDYRVLLLLFCSTIGGEALAQTLAASPYSYFGIGSIYRKGSAHSRSLGGTGIGLRDGYSINTTNPASYTAVTLPFSQLTEVSLMVTAGVQQENSATGKEVDLDFPGMSLWFRLSDNWASTVGLAPYSNVDYHIVDEASFIGLNSQYITEYTGVGGLSQVYLGLARTVLRNLSVGAHVSYIFGPLTAEQYITSNSTDNWQINQNTYLHTLNLDVGVQYELQWEKSSLTLGSTVNLGSRLKGSYTYQMLQASEVIEEEEESADNYILPASVGFGISWNSMQKWRLSADALMDDWSSATFEQGYQLRNAQRVSFGMERLPNLRSLSYLQRIGYSLGVFHEQNYLTLSGREITTNGITGGIKLPTSGSSFVQLGVEHYVNGHPDLISQNYTQLSCTISFFDIWFVRKKLE
ncbi:hypothetical protein [Tunicatimonas pelagia]|uniref:hypothetical protein n=1 Tax=Tunicatimonas pelagia TaxID=931531 RepID=UPI002666B7E5|nr:hypothetical protein [Tunicatimonas pelagia]WKN42743.1 hypothetical protein P0M28_27275 [Tunicatimonas pelagia]